MASGLKGSIKPTGGTPDLSSNYSLFTPSATTTVIVSVCNQATAADTVRIAVSSASPGPGNPIPAEDFIEFDYSLAANSAYERTGIVVATGQAIYCGSANGTVSFVAYGLES